MNNSNHTHTVENEWGTFTQAIPVFALPHDETFIEAKIRFEKKAIQELTQSLSKVSKAHDKLQNEVKGSSIFIVNKISELERNPSEKYGFKAYKTYGDISKVPELSAQAAEAGLLMYKATNTELWYYESGKLDEIKDAWDKEARRLLNERLAARKADYAGEVLRHNRLAAELRKEYNKIGDITKMMKPLAEVTSIAEEVL